MVLHVHRGKFRDAIKEAGLLDETPVDVWEDEWNVNCQAVGASAASLKYLAPHVFKVAIANSRILKVENRTVTLRYQKPKSSRWRTMAIEVLEFIRRFPQHVLPTGFMKVRYFGFMNPNCKVKLDTISALIEQSHGFSIPPPQSEFEPWKPTGAPNKHPFSEKHPWKTADDRDDQSNLLKNAPGFATSPHCADPSHELPPNLIITHPNQYPNSHSLPLRAS
ncbi:MAG TPA: hypothetical protein DCE18_05230 [Syntrophobacteraceae bacterium]|nr:hypothetical protein [Syntrophobacteraceae bacterium]